ncbi:hypothetical protein FN846DRAFT_920957 [Sphaerosporella brunnea]|uniref:Uncharacterized protein n=1 Tax=Sphaerosporella brunnea TaxID=1250544 RepID=A0A5J5EQP0_9PEZI|nr:hypothetical protein FN846DRAFT_920952 [Sphaerosporella brunnea]KAA8899720.1 hypothetical protein FN846DRAFT_920957 [Sphaerosporella brunnea]
MKSSPILPTSRVGLSGLTDSAYRESRVTSLSLPQVNLFLSSRRDPRKPRTARTTATCTQTRTYLIGITWLLIARMGSSEFTIHQRLRAKSTFYSNKQPLVVTEGISSFDKAFKRPVQGEKTIEGPRYRLASPRLSWSTPKRWSNCVYMPRPGNKGEGVRMLPPGYMFGEFTEAAVGRFFGGAGSVGEEWLASGM